MAETLRTALGAGHTPEDMIKSEVLLTMDDYFRGSSVSSLIAHWWRALVELIADPRAKQLPFMDNPLPTLGMIIIYLLWVLLIGPMYMRDRKPMDLRRGIIFYNLFQVLLSGYMFYEHLMAGWLRGYSFTCQPVDYSDSQLSRRMFNLCYVYYLSKLTEFADTVFFVLRKKQSQITDLHVYHHSLTPIEAWILTKFIAGGNATLPNVVNNFVHVLMYFYYMLSAMGPRYQKYLWWKKYMTEVQIIQFIICIAHCINALVTGCPFPRFISTLLLLNASIFLALFMNFYIESYKRKPKGDAGKGALPAATVTGAIEPASATSAPLHSGVQELSVDVSGKLLTSPKEHDGGSAAQDDINNNRAVVDGQEPTPMASEKKPLSASLSVIPDLGKVIPAKQNEVTNHTDEKEEKQEEEENVGSASEEVTELLLESSGLRHRISPTEHEDDTRTAPQITVELASG